MSANKLGATQSLTAALAPIAGVKGVQFVVEGKPLADYWGPEYARALMR